MAKVSWYAERIGLLLHALLFCWAEVFCCLPEEVLCCQLEYSGVVQVDICVYSYTAELILC